MKDRVFRLLITGGGTAGHITPGIAVVEAIRGRKINHQIRWIGVKGRAEEDLVPRANIELLTIQVNGLERSIKPGSIIRNTRTILDWMILRPLRTGLKLLESFRPDVVLGTGGYVCVPILFAARFLGIPTMILEQNSVPGLSVRLFARFADAVGIAYPDSASMLPAHKVILVGNPILKSVMNADRNTAMTEFDLNPKLRTILVIGGSLGSEQLNQAVRRFLELRAMHETLDSWQMIHSVGKNKFPDFMKTIQPSKTYHPFPYIYNPAMALAASDLVVCRAGAMTLAEITARGLPAIIVPWAGAVRNHQYTNAQSLAESGAALMIPDHTFSGDVLFEKFQELEGDADRLQEMAQASRRMGKPEAAEIVLDCVLRLCDKHDIVMAKELTGGNTS